MHKLYSLLIGLLIPFCISATHIIGGTIMYKYLGNDSFEISVRLYRDCNGTTPFPNSVSVTVTDTSGSASGSYTTTLDSVSNVPSYLPVCISSSSVCIEEGFYTTVRYLPPIAGGRHIFYSYCCRTSYLNNIMNPLSTGYNIYTFIPDQATLNNNSAVWNLRPPLFECQNQPMNYDYGATDADGDSLVYSYYTPFNDQAPAFPSDTIDFSPTNWSAGFGPNNPTGGPNLTMFSTGFIIGAPQSIGWYAAGVRCEEFRNGVKIAEIRRDYPFIVISCPPAPAADFIAPLTSCYQNYIQYQNMSLGATTYHWDFGDTNITNDTSTLVNPQWLYANPGVYTVTLIADPNTACADTATWVITVEQVHADYIVNDTLFTIVGNQFTDSSWTTDNVPIVQWWWDFGDATPVSNAQNPTHVYSTTGTYTVTLIVLSGAGCFDTTTFIVYVDVYNSIAEQNSPAMAIYPNPSDGNFSVQLAYPEQATIRLLDISGREITAHKTSGELLLEMNLVVAPGTYLLEYHSAERRSVQKIIVE